MSDNTPEIAGPDFPDLSDLFRQAQAMQAQLMEAQAAVAEQEVEGASGGGAVRIVATGGLEFRSVTIDPAVLAESDSTMVEDLVLAALHDVMDKVNELNASTMGSLPGLGGLLG
jgi:DNA-binding YbaB/EbfC family protein